MKKLYTIFVLVIAAGITAHAQCTIDTAAAFRPGITPAPENIPCIERSVAYSQTLQVQCPDHYDSVINFGIASYPVQVTIDSMELTAVTGLPSGITWVKNPNVLPGGQKGCITFSGTTSDPVGPYNLGWYGTVWASLPSPVPANLRHQTYTGNLNKYSYVNYYFNVINQGDSCAHFSTWPAGVNDINAELASSFHVYPNPSNGSFELSLNATKSINGQFEITDVTGRMVYSQQIEANGSYTTHINLSSYSKGLYIIRLRTADGFAAKTISIE